MNDDEIKKSFVALRCTKPDGTVNNMASGCLVTYQNKLFLLTVFHGVGFKSDDEKWLMELKWNQSIMRMGSIDISRVMNFLSSFSIDENTRADYLNEILETRIGLNDIDFAWYKFPYNEIEAYYQEITNINGYATNIMKKTIHIIDFNIKPDSSKKYCFGGYTRKTNINTNSTLKIFENHLSIERDWKFVREEYIENKGEMYIFKPIGSFKGNDFYAGCSGSPIMDKDGNIVSLVVGRNDNTEEMWGINLSAYKLAIDASIGNI